MLLEKCEKFRNKYKISKARFGEMVMGSPKFIFDLEKGRECLPRTERKILRFMEEYEMAQKGAENGNS